MEDILHPFVIPAPGSGLLAGPRTGSSRDLFLQWTPAFAGATRWAVIPAAL